MCKKNGGVYIKLGQHMSALTYLFPSEYTETLSELHDACPVSSVKDMDQVCIDDLGVGIDQLFSFFDPKPVGSASLAQVCLIA